MDREEPEKLHEKTPQWFKEWHDKTFWHFKYHVEHKLDWHDKILWGIFAAVIVSVILKFFFD